MPASRYSTRCGGCSPTSATGIRRVNGTEATGQTVTHRVTDTADATQRHQVSIGRIGLRRTYRANGSGRVMPVSATARAGRRRDDDPHDGRRAVRARSETGRGRRRERPWPHAGREGAAARVAGELRQPCLPTRRNDPARAPAPAAGERSTLTLAPVRNVHELGRSNYAGTLADMDGVLDHVVDFTPQLRSTRRARRRADRRGARALRRRHPTSSP